ncbi:UDP-glucosyltransferase 2-like [Tribolium madens]|uniref:UDP-glucosyltransferase 2-like n=1 Tax=Tribolium madens TaxID=41895 RepID=UPI001CF74612|nr:UDP-glucosyltransferase 2-like [Tribolium madens]XP_044255720.1 UDP-glucosyltransferase 2-like [Tribolium madens]
MRLVFFIIISIFTIGQTANILGIFPLPGKSHFVMFERLLMGLAEKGHNVDVATHFPRKEPTPRYNQLSLVGSLPILVNNLSFNLFDGFTNYDMMHFMTKICGVDVCAATLNTSVLRNLKNTKKKYDLVITEIFGSDCMLGFGHYFKAPTVSLISSISLPWAGDRIGNPDNPSYIPNYFVSSTAKMSLFERVENTIMLMYTKFLYHYFSSKESNQIAREFFGPELPSLEELARNTSLVIVNSHFSISHARPTVPNFIEVGGLHIHEAKPLSKHFEDLVTTDANKGIIYLTMGSMIMTETFDPAKLQGMFDAFAELPYKVLWKAKRENFPKGLKIPKNIYFENWMPQMDILCHPNVKLFVSHGGLMGSQEAVYCGVPRLGIPLFADQDNNIRASERMGLSIKVAYNDISKKTILEASKKLLEDPTYKKNAEQISKQFKDRPLSPLDTAIFWVEYVIRHNGAPQLRSAGADLPWYQYYLIDVVVILASGLFIFILSTIYVLKLVLHFIYGNHKHKTE